MNDYLTPYQQGMENVRCNNYVGAVWELNRALLIKPDFAAAFYQRGLAHYGLKDFRQAILDYTCALRLQPNAGDCYFHRAMAYLAAGNLPAALADATHLLQLRPDYAAGYDLRGKIRKQAGDFDGAIADFKDAAQRYLAQKDAANGRDCLLQIEWAKAAIANSDAPSVEITAFLQQALEKALKGFYQEALEDLDWAVTIDPQDPHAYFARAQVRSEMCDWQGAIADYQQAGQFFAARADKEHLKQAIAAIEQLKAKASLAAARSAMAAPTSSTPLSPAIQRKLLRLVGDDRRTAIRLVNQLRLKNPGMPEDWYWEKAIYDLQRDRH